MTGVAKKAAAARRAALSPSNPGAGTSLKNSHSAPENEPVYFTEHKIDSIIYEQDEEIESSSTAGTPGSVHNAISRTKSVTKVYSAKDDQSVIVVCHDAESNEVDCNEPKGRGSTAVNTPSSMDGVANTPSSLSGMSTKRETGSLLIEVSDKLNSMPKHHKVTLSNSIPTDEQTLDSLTHKYRRHCDESITPGSVSESDDDVDDPSTSEELGGKERRYQRNIKAGMKTVDDFAVGKNAKYEFPARQLTLSVPNLHALSTSNNSSGISTPRISRSPRLTPKPSPRLSPRLAHTVHNVKRKISEAVKHEMQALIMVGARSES